MAGDLPAVVLKGGDGKDYRVGIAVSSNQAVAGRICADKDGHRGSRVANRAVVRKECPILVKGFVVDCQAVGDDVLGSAQSPLAGNGEGKAAVAI